MENRAYSARHGRLPLHPRTDRFGTVPRVRRDPGPDAGEEVAAGPERRDAGDAPAHARITKFTVPPPGPRSGPFFGGLARDGDHGGHQAPKPTDLVALDPHVAESGAAQQRLALGLAIRLVESAVG